MLIWDVSQTPKLSWLQRLYCFHPVKFIVGLACVWTVGLFIGLCIGDWVLAFMH